MTWRPELPGWSDDIHHFYDWLATTMPNDAHHVEVGVAWGRSLLYLTEALIAKGKRATLWAVDTWRNVPDCAGAPPYDPLYFMLEHMSERERAMVNVIQAPSVQAAGLFALRHGPRPWSVFIDGDHRYESALADICAWLAVVGMQPGGGIVAGHDYEPKAWPGVVKAVDEVRRAITHGATFNVSETVWSLDVRKDA